MQETRWRRIEKIFSRAVTIPKTDRQAFVEENCGEDEELCREILALLWEDEENSDFLSEPVFAAGLQILDADFTNLLKKKEFAHYKLLKQLGQGGTGIVFLAEDERLKRRAALKIITPSLTSQPEIIKRFQQEARAASNISHPNVAHIYEFSRHDEYYFLAMEYVAGKTLRELLNEKRVDRNQALEIALQTTEALAAAHRNGITHRDIKPENIVITDDGRVKVLDFGLAKISEENPSADPQILDASVLETTPGMIIGTIAYMSPEQIRGQTLDARTDLWSLGVVFYEMLNGKRPFEGETRSDVLAAILKNEIFPSAEPDSENTKKVEGVMLKALRKNREERYQTAEELRDDLREVKKNSSLKQTPAKLIQTESRSAGQNGALNILQKHKITFTVGAIILLFATLGLWLSGSDSSTETAPIGSIAVLPFTNESGDENKEFLSDGITESLINRLSQLPNMTVKARNSVFQYKGKKESLQIVGRNLSVQAILLGRIAGHGDNLMISVELVDVRTGNQIWGEQYNRKTADIVSLQTELVRDVSENLRKKLSGAEQGKLAKKQTESGEAFMLYLKGRFHWSKRTAKDLQKSIEYFEQAVGLDPQFALAYSGMADSYVLFSGFGIAPPDESFPKAKKAAQKALEIDEGLAEAHTALSYALFNYDWNFEESEKQIRRAIELNPNYATAHHWNGNANLLAMGRFDKAIASVKRAHELDPLSLIISADLATAYLYAGRFDEAVAQYKKTLELDDNFYYAHAYLGRTYMMKGAYAKALDEFEKAEKLGDDPRVLMLKARAYSKMGSRGDALKMLDKLKQMSKERYISPYYFALVYTGLGDKDKAFEWLEKALREREGRMTLIKVDALLNELHTDTRFSDLLKRVGLEVK